MGRSNHKNLKRKKLLTFYRAGLIAGAGYMAGYMGIIHYNGGGIGEMRTEFVLFIISFILLTFDLVRLEFREM